MKIETFNHNWKFWEDKDAFALVWDIPEIARDITLPHDAMIEREAHAESPNGGNTGYRDGAVYNYVNLFFAPEEYKHKTVMLKFEGVYMNAFVYVNGQLAGKRPYGYSQFYVALNDFLKYGQENEIRVQARNGAMTNSRWYSGGGIYRDVYLLTSELSYIVPDGVCVVTEEAEEALAVLSVSTELANRSHIKEGLTLETILYDDSRKEVARDVIPAVLFAGEEKKLHQRMAVEAPKLWDEHHPNLYTCVTRLYRGGSLTEDNLVDEQEAAFGIRTLSLDAKRGLRVNGKEVKLRGACIHHDSGLLGAATYEDAQLRQVKLLKEAGFNAIRMAHHPMASNMLRACDALGMYVMDESFDMWSRSKSDYDYGMNFQEWWERDVEEMVRKDRNHPSVILYSLGNEIPEIGTDYGARLCQQQADKVKQLDPTRYTLASINGIFAAGDAISQIVSDIAKSVEERGEVLKGNVNNFMSLMDAYMDDIVNHPALSERLDKACAAVDIAGYNYMTARYEKDVLSYPNRVIVGSETFTPEIARNWELVKKYTQIIGDFTWTGWDYIGEAGIGVPGYQPGEGGFDAGFPVQLAYPGDIDITGYRRPTSYFREIVFGLRKKPYITIQNPYHYGETLIKTPWILSDSVSCWNYPGMEGKPVTAEVYSAGDEVELLLNGRSLGRKPAGAGEDYIVTFEITYEPGTLTAVSYQNGEELGRMELCSAGENRRIVVTPDTVGKELIYLPVEICDENGVLAADAAEKLTITVEGGAVLAGFGSGSPRPGYNYTESRTKTWNGRALAILKRCGQGSIKVTVKGEAYGQTVLEL